MYDQLYQLSNVQFSELKIQGIYKENHPLNIKTPPEGPSRPDTAVPGKAVPVYLSPDGPLYYAQWRIRGPMLTQNCTNLLQGTPSHKKWNDSSIKSHNVRWVYIK